VRASTGMAGSTIVIVSIPRDAGPPGAHEKTTGPEAPRPGRNRINGRSPGSRVFACHRLPGNLPVAPWLKARRIQLRGQLRNWNTRSVPHSLFALVKRDRRLRSTRWPGGAFVNAPPFRQLGLAPLWASAIFGASSVPAVAGANRERGHGKTGNRKPDAAAAPATVGGDVPLDRPLDPKGSGKAKGTMSREPGDLPATATANVLGWRMKGN
jgi:hypothetical protein